jgi:hypothetical protein
MTQVMLLPALRRSGNNCAANRDVCDGDGDACSIGVECGCEKVGSVEG